MQPTPNKLLVVLNAIAAPQSKATIRTEQLVHTLLDYVAMYPNDGIVYRASDMVLCAHADASYLNKTKSCSRAGAHIYLSEDDPVPRFNGAVLTIATIIKLTATVTCPLLKFCTNKPTLASLLRQFLGGGEKGGVSPKKKV